MVYLFVERPRLRLPLPGHPAVWRSEALSSRRSIRPALWEVDRAYILFPSHKPGKPRKGKPIAQCYHLVWRNRCIALGTVNEPSRALGGTKFSFKRYCTRISAITWPYKRNMVSFLPTHDAILPLPAVLHHSTVASPITTGKNPRYRWWSVREGGRAGKAADRTSRVSVPSLHTAPSQPQRLNARRRGSQRRSQLGSRETRPAERY